LSKHLAEFNDWGCGSRVGSSHFLLSPLHFSLFTFHFPPNYNKARWKVHNLEVEVEEDHHAVIHEVRQEGGTVEEEEGEVGIVFDPTR